MPRKSQFKDRVVFSFNSERERIEKLKSYSIKTGISTQRLMNDALDHLLGLGQEKEEVVDDNPDGLK